MQIMEGFCGKKLVFVRIQYSGLKCLTLIYTQTADKLGALVACQFPTVTFTT